MPPRRMLVATRNAGKLREIRSILSASELVTLDDIGVPPSPEEDAIEAFSTFRENALAKARFWSERTGLPALADDSGLVVPALGGLPGVRSKRFAADAGRLPEEAEGMAVDEANNRLLVERLRGIAGEERAAYYVCAAALVGPGEPDTVGVGTWAGRIAERPAGDGGFGYDPLFLLPELGRTAAQLPQAEKDRRSHRARALRALAAARGGHGGSPPGR